LEKKVINGSEVPAQKSPPQTAAGRNPFDLRAGRGVKKGGGWGGRVRGPDAPVAQKTQPIAQPARGAAAVLVRHQHTLDQLPVVELVGALAGSVLHVHDTAARAVCVRRCEAVWKGAAMSVRGGGALTLLTCSDARRRSPTVLFLCGEGESRGKNCWRREVMGVWACRSLVLRTRPLCFYGQRPTVKKRLRTSLSPLSQSLFIL